MQREESFVEDECVRPKRVHKTDVAKNREESRVVILHGESAGSCRDEIDGANHKNPEILHASVIENAESLALHKRLHKQDARTDSKRNEGRPEDDDGIVEVLHLSSVNTIACERQGTQKGQRTSKKLIDDADATDISLGAVLFHRERNEADAKEADD